VLLAAELKPPPAWKVILTMGLYHLIFLIGFLLYSPVLIWRMMSRPDYRGGILQRMGYVPRSPSDRPVVWIHGVSVGEIKAAGDLIERLRRDHADFDLVLSTTTPTGYSVARQIHPDLRVVYYPLDFGLFPRRALDRIRPTFVLLLELEVWPNFLQAAVRRRVPVVVVNGRMTERSFRGYKRIRGFLPQFNLIRAFCVQDESYGQRLLALDVEADRIFVTGNIKYDSVLLKDCAGGGELRDWLSADGRLVLVCGSTHHDEELRLSSLVHQVSDVLGQPVRLVVAPRHPERSGSVRDVLEAEGRRCALWSQARQPWPALADDDIVLVDMIGQLESFYSACDVAFVGGSLVSRGGQNMLEPAALGKAVIFGPNTVNFRTDVSLLLSANAAVQVADDESLGRELLRLFRDVELRHRLGQRAIELIRKNQGATDRTLALLQPLLALPSAGGPLGSGHPHEQPDQREADPSQHDRGLVGGESV